MISIFTTLCLPGANKTILDHCYLTSAKMTFRRARNLELAKIKQPELFVHLDCTSAFATSPWAEIAVPQSKHVLAEQAAEQLHLGRVMCSAEQADGRARSKSQSKRDLAEQAEFGSCARKLGCWGDELCWNALFG